MTDSNIIISAKNLVVRYGRTKVLDIEDLNVIGGRTLALIGPNGSGKSTLLLTLAGLLPPACGQLYFQGMPLNDGNARAALRRNASVVFQETLLLNDTVYNNVALGLKFRHLNRSEIKKTVEESLDYFGIRHLAARPAKNISGGEAKRVSLARAFALKPKLILLDEAFNFLDPPSREGIIDDLRNILGETKITAVMALHDREETLRLAQDVCVMSGGKIIQSGTTADIFNRPADEFVADFVGTETILEGVVKNSREGISEIVVNDSVIEAAGEFGAGQKVYCCLRPEHITISSAMAGKISARNVFAAKVQKIIRQAYFYKVFLDCGFCLVAYITLPSFEDLKIQEGITLTASFKATAVYVMRREK